MDPDTVRLRSPLPPAECAARLLAAIDPEQSWRPSWSNTALPKPVIGSVRGPVVRLSKRSDLYRNSFQTYLTAELRPAGTGTLIVGHTGMHAFVRVFMALWFTFLALLTGGMVLMAMLGPATRTTAARAQGSGWDGLWIPLGLLAFGVALVLFGRYCAQDEGDFLEDFLARTLDARPADDF